MSETIKLEIPRSSRFIVIARKTAECIARRAKLSNEQVGDLLLAVGEACSNAVKFADKQSDHVHVTYSLEPDRLTVEVSNDGNGFLRPPVPRVNDEMQEGGMGLWLIEQVMDELVISTDEGHTSVRMVKRIAN
ncbi:MAG: ATP-binding protein [Armatimonadota bacterium]